MVVVPLAVGHAIGIVGGAGVPARFPVVIGLGAGRAGRVGIAGGGVDGTLAVIAEVGALRMGIATWN